MKVDRRKLSHWRLLILQGLYTLLAIALRSFTVRPAKPLIILYGHQFNGNLKALYEEWRQTGPDHLELACLTLDPTQYQELRTKGIHTLACFRWRDMRNLSRCSVIITDHGLHAMLPLTYLSNIRFVDVWHGIPFKGFTPEDFKLQHRHDEVWVSSPLLKDLYVERFGFSPEKVKSLGYARTDKLFQRPSPPSTFRGWAMIPKDQKLVLYAPTWRQDDAGRELFPFGASQKEFTTALAETCASVGARLVIRAHLNASISGGDSDDILYCPQKDYPDTEDLLLATDILICDWSSIAFDFMALERPTLFLDVPAPFKHGFSLGPEYRFGCLIPNLEELRTALRKYLLTPGAYEDVYTARQRETITALYGKFTGVRSARKQLERLTELTPDTAR
ncbi:CDP-glycerol glycerophosphotransferase family protein [Haliea sp. E1-2-M8]|uniref:CDP-glycerol glycerophosphotransferase family protein n=1 Tax=Haliea sp. E1-2-M8 TaxID=3064706 RepID=UPI00272347D7|nr:CDP-glycerol glycerophosphotransferase family protein [Haliea sp. E1-2-M8]MDO8863364.1 CDP-glycerol glycerophosphotransferase family protein [Haliea sp. E1-2-M8]